MVNPMVIKAYVRQIRRKNLTLDDVPEQIRDDVKAELEA